MNTNSIPGIRDIRVIPCPLLPKGAMMHSICGCLVTISAPATTVPFIGTPTLAWESTMADGASQEKSTLQFTTARPLTAAGHLAFVITAADGRCFLIGTREGRFPKIEYSATTGDPARTPSLFTYKISHIAQKSVLPCLL